MLLTARSAQIGDTEKATCSFALHGVIYMLRSGGVAPLILNFSTRLM